MCTRGDAEWQELEGRTWEPCLRCRAARLLQTHSGLLLLWKISRLRKTAVLLAAGLATEPQRVKWWEEPGHRRAPHRRHSHGRVHSRTHALLDGLTPSESKQPIRSIAAASGATSLWAVSTRMALHMTAICVVAGFRNVNMTSRFEQIDCNGRSIPSPHFLLMI